MKRELVRLLREGRNPDGDVAEPDRAERDPAKR